MSQVFISYSRKDIEFVDRLANDLKAAGFEVWYDLSGLEAGTQWGSEIQKAIETSQFFLIVLSPNSIKSSWVEREFLHASDQDIKIIPLLYQQCSLPMWSLNLHFIDMQGKNYARKYHELLMIMGVQPESNGDNPISTRYIEIGDEYRKRGQAAQAIESYLQALKADPGNLKAQSNIGAIHLEEQAYQEAAAAFELALQISGEDLVAQAGWCDANLSLGNQARADGNIEEATGFYLEVLRVSPGETDACKSLANISKSRAEDLLDAGKEDEAISAFSEALTYTPQDAALSTLIKKLESEKKARVLNELFARSDKALADGNWEGAIAPLNEALESAPQEESILKKIELVREQQREEQLKDILLKVERAEESERWDTAIAGLNEYLQMKKDDKAVQKRMADLMASKRSTWLNSINLQVDQAVENRKWDEAIGVLNEALEIEPDNKELKARAAQVKKDQISVKLNAIILRADQAAVAGRWDDSIEILNNGLIDDPNEKMLKAKLAEIMQSKREEKLKSALNLADMAARTEKWETAVTTLNEILASEPDNPIFLKKFDEVLKLERNSKIKNLRMQAQNLVKAEKFEEALAAWNELLTLEPENRQAVLNEIEAVNKAQKMADLYFKGTEAAAEKDHLKAVEYFKRIEIEDANYKNTAKLRAKAEKRLGGEGKTQLSRRRIWLTGGVLSIVVLGIGAIVFWPGKNIFPTIPAQITNNTILVTNTPDPGSLDQASAPVTTLEGKTNSPTFTTWQTAPTATATPIPAWVYEISEPILAAIKNSPPDFVDDFSQVDPGWFYSQYEIYSDVLCSNTDGPKVSISDGSMKCSVDPNCQQGVLSHPVMNRTYANYVLQMDVNFKQTSGALMFRYFDFSERYEELNFYFSPLNWGFVLCNPGLNIERIEGRINFDPSKPVTVTIINKPPTFLAYMNSSLVLAYNDLEMGYGLDLMDFIMTTENFKSPETFELDNIKIWDLDRIE
ncbi:MAG: TIR domain-containing protein [Anaerolineales bacterium]|nr:TIR domain-containing protein [Anaerolineales bacterium]